MSRKTKSKPVKLDARAQAKLRAALYEAGHFIVAKHFGVAEVSGLHRVGNVYQFAGRTVYGSTSGFNEAVIGWSGPLAEQKPGRTPEQWKAASQMVWQMFAENQLSKADTDLINRHVEMRKTFAQAVEILALAEKEIVRATSTLFKQDSLFNFP